ncbi:MAG: NUDIX domain-containing protein [Patescibacteria group bacterium]
MLKPKRIARGIILNNDKILLCKNLKHGSYFLPGGHIENEESAQNALAREVREEMGKVVLSSKKISGVENTFTEDDIEHREVIYLYSVELQDYENIKSLEDHIDFEWILITDFSKINFRPEKMTRVVLKNIKK